MMDLLEKLVVAFLYFSRTTFNHAQRGDGNRALGKAHPQWSFTLALFRRTVKEPR